APWWLVRRAHAARDKKLVVWVPTALAPQVDKILQEQFYAYTKQAGLKENEIDYSILGTTQMLPKLVASLEAANPPDLAHTGPNLPSSCRSKGPLLEVPDIVEKMQKTAGGLSEASLKDVMYKGKAYAVPQSVTPGPLVPRLDILEAAKVEPAKTWDEFIELC